MATPSVGEQIVAAMVVALNAPGDKPATTYRARVDAVGKSEGDVIVLHAMEEDPTIESRNRYLRRRKIRLEIYAAGAAEPADANIDPIYVYAVNTLMASETVGSFLRQLAESKLQFGVAAGEQGDMAAAFLDFEAVYETTADPTVSVIQ